MPCNPDCGDAPSHTLEDLANIARHRVGEYEAGAIFWAIRRIKATEEGSCGHNWDRSKWNGCPVCAMQDGTTTRIKDLEHVIDGLTERMDKYRQLCSCMLELIGIIPDATWEDVEQSVRWAFKVVTAARHAVETQDTDEFHKLQFALRDLDALVAGINGKT